MELLGIDVHVELLGKVCGSVAKASNVATSTFEFFSNNSYLNKNYVLIALALKRPSDDTIITLKLLEV